MADLRVVKEYRPDLERFTYRIEEMAQAGPNVHPYVKHSDGLLCASDPEDLIERVKDIQRALRKPVLHHEVTMRWVNEKPILK